MARNSAQRFSPNYGARRAKMETLDEGDNTQVPAPAADDSMLPSIGVNNHLAVNTDAVNT